MCGCGGVNVKLWWCRCADVVVWWCIYVVVVCM